MTTSSEKSHTRFTRACLGEPVDRTPVWMMRQAGRYMPEYQALRQRYSFLELCKTPAVAAQATLDAAHYLKTDAAIIFSDITLPAEAMGLDLQFSPGPRFANPVRSLEDVKALVTPDPRQAMAYVMEAIKLTRAELDPDISLIGFIGAPLTLSAYMIEGNPSNHAWIEFKKLLYGDTPVLEALLERVTEMVTEHALAQVEAGCDAIQLFDTNAGQLAPRELQSFAFAFAQRVIQALQPLGVPVIYFARGIGAHLEKAAELNANVLGLDWSVSVSEARKRLGSEVGLMGNLDPTVLLTNPSEIDKRVKSILDEARGHKGFVFNLGHGVLPKTPPPNAKQVVASVNKYGATS